MRLAKFLAHSGVASRRRSEKLVAAGRVSVGGQVVRDPARVPSNWRSTRSLDAMLEDQGIVGITDVDTRALVRHIREVGAQPGCILSPAPTDEEARRIAATVPGLTGRDLVQGVTTPEPYCWIEPPQPLHETEPTPTVEKVEPPYRVVAFDFGVKNNILRELVRRGCHVTVVPASCSVEETLAYEPEGIFLSNGPGDPSAVPGIQDTVRSLVGRLPVFGICLGHQILALSLGGTTYKLKFGHRGANHPVGHVDTGEVEITSQNHGFAVEAESLPEGVHVTHMNLNDNTVAGFADPDRQCYSVQYHPEASPGPHDAHYLFDPFVGMMEARRRG